MKYHDDFVLTGLFLSLLKSFFLISLKPFYLTVGLVLIFPPAAMIKECADKYSITFRIEEEEIKYRSTLYLTCPKYLGRIHVHTGDTTPELSPGKICSSLVRTEDVYAKNLKRELTSEKVLVGTNVF